MQYKMVAIDAFDETDPAIMNLEVVLPTGSVQDGNIVEHLAQLFVSDVLESVTDPSRASKASDEVPT